MLPWLVNQNRCKEIWKDDQEFNQLLSQHGNFLKHDAEYKAIIKAVKEHIKQLRNEKLRQESDEMNENASWRQVEQLYKNMKDDNTQNHTWDFTTLIQPYNFNIQIREKNTSRHI